MIPEDRLSSTTFKGDLLNPWSRQANLSRHWGPVALQDPSLGLLVKLWQMRAEQGGNDLLLSSAGVVEHIWYTHTKAILVVSLAFDQNGRPIAAFEDEDGDAFLRWFDPTPNAIVTTALPYATTPRVTLDDARDFNISNSDVILGYVRANIVRYRRQRDRFNVEYTPPVGVSGSPAQATALRHISMNSNLRLEFLTDAAGDATWTVAEVVAELCWMAGIPGQNISVKELYDDVVQGLKVDSNDGLAEPIDQLRQVFFFDKAEYDKRLHFPKRGRDVVARIPYRDLVRGNPTALKQERQDETDLAREVNINHLDPDGGFAKNKQFAQRRSNLINAQGKKNIETQVVLTVDQAATTADTLLRIDWNELVEYKFSTTIKYTYLTVGDVIEVEDKAGTWHRMRLEERNEDGNIEWEATMDAGARTYGKARTGNALPPPTSTTPGLVGETRIELINCSPLRDQDDELGVYVAAAGDNSAWTGYQMLISTDNGTSYYEAYQAQAPSTLGETVTDLPHALGYEYQSTQSVELTCNFPIASITYEQLLGNLNRIVIGDEVLQFQTATLLGMVGTKYHYRLTGLLRGRYATETPYWPAGARFVFIDETLVFAQAQRAMFGTDIYYKPVSFGLTEDETVSTAYLFDQPSSQTEWPVTLVEAARDAGAVVVNWVGVARLGNDTNPFHSKYFAGYRVKFSDGHTIDTPNMTASYTGAPASVGVQVCALNSITGEGPYSTSILVP